MEQALKLDEKLVPALTLYAKIAMSRDRFDAARDSLERALAVDPDSEYARFLYGLNFYLWNDLQHALPQFEQARRENPKDARAALYLGLTYESLGKLPEAAASYGEAARLEPSAETFLVGGRLLMVMGRFEEAETWIRKAVALEPESRDAHFELARLLLHRGAVADAANEAERALALKGASASDARIHYLLSQAYRTSNPALSAQHREAVREAGR